MKVSQSSGTPKYRSTMDAAADAPTRATNNVTLRLGLMACNVQFFAAVEDTKPVERHTYHRKTDEPIGTVKVIKATGKLVTNEDCAMKVLVGEKLVELTDDEMLAATAGQAVDKGNVEIQTFVPEDAIGTKYLVDNERLYQARPAPKEVGRKKVVDSYANKVFALLLGALAEKKVAALFRVGLRGTARYAVLSADGFVRFLFFPDEVRQPRDFPEVDVNPAELAQVCELIDAIGSDTPDLVNTAKEAIMECLVAKAAGLTAPTAVVAPVEAEVLDLTAALAASVKAAKAKPKKKVA